VQRQPCAALRRDVDECRHHLFPGMLMLSIRWKEFLHPAGVYRLEYPDHWEHLQKAEARSCGFGPYDRDDVGIWVSVLPYSVDSGRLAEEFLSNLHKEVRAAPAARAQIIQHFVESLGQSMDLPLGEESWEDAQARLLPLLKPRSFLDSDFANRSLLVSEWLADVVICYALRSNDIFRFVTNRRRGPLADGRADRCRTGRHQSLPARLAQEAGRGAAAGRRARDRHYNERRVGVEPTAPSRPAPAVLRPPRKSVPGGNSGSRYTCCLF